MNIWVIPKSFKKNCVAKKSFIVPWPKKKISDKENKHVLKVRDKCEMKAMKFYQNLCSKCDVLLLSDLFEKLRNSILKNMDYVHVIIWAHQV